LIAACQQTEEEATTDEAFGESSIEQGQGGDETAGVVVDGLRYTAEVKLVGEAPTELQVPVTVTNLTDKTVRLEHGVCSALLAFDDPALSGEPVWSSEERYDPVTGNRYVCPAVGMTETIAPGESVSPETLRPSVPTYEIVGHPLLGRFLPDGSYHWLVRVDVTGRDIEVPAGQVLVEMGEPPLPSQRSAAGLLYQLETRPSATSPATIESTLTVVNESNEAVETSIARNCPFSLYVYREKARRDAAYVAGEPDWRVRGECLLEMVSFDLAPGQSRRFTTTASAAEFLGHSLPDGRYYLAAVVWLQEKSMWLAAGEVQLER